MSTRTMFRTVARVASLTERTAAQLEDLIVRHSLKAGDRFPSERELGERLGVSKTVIREAIRSLGARGLVEVRPGSGTYVRGFNREVMSRPLNLLLRLGGLKPEHIDEVRQVLEMSIVARAAELATAADIDAMDAAIRALSAPSLSAVEFAEADVDFHCRLAEAAGNPLFSVLSNAINDVMIEVRLRAYERYPQCIERAIFFHTRILDFVRASDVEGAREAMHEHLRESSAVMRKP